MAPEYQTALVWQAGYLAMRFPAPLSKALAERRYNRAHLTVTDEGILLRPYLDESARGNTLAQAELPDWDGA